MTTTPAVRMPRPTHPAVAAIFSLAMSIPLIVASHRAATAAEVVPPAAAAPAASARRQGPTSMFPNSQRNADRPRGHPRQLRRSRSRLRPSPNDGRQSKRSIADDGLPADKSSPAGRTDDGQPLGLRQTVDLGVQNRAQVEVKDGAGRSGMFIAVCSDLRRRRRWILTRDWTATR